MSSIIASGRTAPSPANTALPVVIAADFNTAANNPADSSYRAYRQFVAAGLVDEWLMANASSARMTCCQAPLLTNTTSLLSNRIDLVFASSALCSEERNWWRRSNIEPNVFSASDHAGVFAKLKFSNSTGPASRLDKHSIRAEY